MPCTCRIETACTSTLRVLKNKVTVSNCTGLVSLNMQLMQKWTSSDKSLGAGYRVVENGCNSDQIVHIHVLHPCEISFASSNWKLNSCPREKLAQGFHNGLTFAAGCLLSNRWHLMACRFGESLVTSTFSDVWVAHLASKDVTYVWTGLNTLVGHRAESLTRMISADVACCPPNWNGPLVLCVKQTASWRLGS